MKPRRPRKDQRPSGARQPSRFAEGRTAGPPHVVHVEKPIYGGSFLSRIEGKAVFVPLALPGEEVRLRIVDEKRGYAAAELDEVIHAAPMRIAPLCPFFGPCGGCQYQHAPYAEQLNFKQAILGETFERAGIIIPVAIEVLSADPWSYRNRIRLTFDAQGNPGYRARRSHRLIAIDQCPIAAPLLSKAALAFAGVRGAITPDFRPAELALFCNHDESALLLSIVAPQPIRLPLDRMAEALQQSVSPLSGIELLLEGRPGQPPRTLAQWGDTSINYRVGAINYRVDNGAFFQVNRRLVDVLVERVTQGRNGALAWDLFAGVGLFARRLAENFERVLAVESALTATKALAHNLHAMQAEAVASSTVEFLKRNGRGPRPDLIVVDPPRTGLGPDITSMLNEIAAPRITYVSCDPATLARDLRELIAAGYTIERLTLADLFPQTYHLETIVDLRRG